MTIQNPCRDGAPVLLRSEELLRMDDIEASNKKQVRFDEGSNEEFEIHRFLNKDDKTDHLWYSSIDFEIFTDRVKRRVEHMCTVSKRQQKNVQVLEQAHQACWDEERQQQHQNNLDEVAPVISISSSDDTADDQDDSQAPFMTMSLEDENTAVSRRLIEVYQNDDDLVGMEPYIAEYMPEMTDRSDLRQAMIREIIQLGDNKNKGRRRMQRRIAKRGQLDERSRRLSLGSRLFAREIAQATAAAVEQDRDKAS